MGQIREVGGIRAGEMRWRTSGLDATTTPPAGPDKPNPSVRGAECALTIKSPSGDSTTIILSPSNLLDASSCYQSRCLTDGDTDRQTVRFWRRETYTKDFCVTGLHFDHVLLCYDMRQIKELGSIAIVFRLFNTKHYILLPVWLWKGELTVETSLYRIYDWRHIVFILVFSITGYYIVWL